MHSGGSNDAVRSTADQRAGDSTPVWVYIIIPILSAIVGYLTNVLALWMTFYPLELRPLKLWQPQGQPLGLFGWQVRTMRLCLYWDAQCLRASNPESETSVFCPHGNRLGHMLACKCVGAVRVVPILGKPVTVHRSSVGAVITRCDAGAAAYVVTHRMLRQ